MAMPDPAVGAGMLMTDKDQRRFLTKFTVGDDCSSLNKDGLDLLDILPKRAQGGGAA